MARHLGFFFCKNLIESRGVPEINHSQDKCAFEASVRASILNHTMFDISFNCPQQRGSLLASIPA